MNGPYFNSHLSRDIFCDCKSIFHHIYCISPQKSPFLTSFSFTLKALLADSWMNVVILTMLSVNIYFHLYCILSDMHWLGFKCQTLFLLSLYVNLFFSLAFSAVVFDDCAGNESVEFDVSNPDFLIDENLNLVPRRDVIDSGDVMFVHGVNVHVDDMAQVTIMGAPSRSPQTLRVSFYLWVDFVCVCVCVCLCEFVKWPEVFNLVILNGLLCWRHRMSGHPWFCSFRTGHTCQPVCLYCHRIERHQLRLEITHHVLSWYHCGQPHISFRGDQWQK